MEESIDFEMNMDDDVPGAPVVVPVDEGTTSRDIELDIIDDTPPEDRGRSRMATPPVEPSEEELATYSESVQKRFQHFTKGYHEERRAKEAATREREEALRYAQSVVEENNRLKGSLHQGQNVMLEHAKATVEKEVAEAKRKLREAKEAFDIDGEVNAQQALFAAQLREDRVNNFTPSPLQPTKDVVQPQQTKAAAPNADFTAWHERNEWYLKNRKMTLYAQAVHDDLAEEGIAVGSKEYYRRLDEDVQQRFPETAKGAAPRKGTAVVAPATRSTAPKKVTLTQTQVALAKRLGISVEDYAKQVVELSRRE